MFNYSVKRTLPDLNYVQTKGFNTYAIRRKNKSIINLYDLGGHPSIQELWDHYYADVRRNSISKTIILKIISG